MMTRRLIIIFVLLYSVINLKSQSDTMYVYKTDSILWQYAVPEIDSIIFYQAQTPDTTPVIPIPKIIGFENNSFIDENGDDFFPWGFNYTNPALVDLVEDYWMMEDAWQIIDKDFDEMKTYGANTVRIHLQYVKYMEDAVTPDTVAFNRLERLVQISQNHEIYLIITGLGAYRLSDTLQWYDDMDDAQRWATQKLFWKNVAAKVKNYNCVFAYDLINEPVVAVGCNDTTECSWYPPGGTFGGYQFIQNISINPDNNFWQTIGLWADEMTSAIHSEDTSTMITTGLLPLGPINSLSSHYDIISTHIYPNSNDLSNSINYVLNNQSDKPFLIEEFYNLSCSTTELEFFLNQINGNYNGVIGHYMGKTIEEYDTTNLVEYIHKEFLDFFIENNPNR